MVSASPNVMVNIASLRHELAQHHYAEHNIISALADASLKYFVFCDTIIKKEGSYMKENKLVEMSMDFSVEIINLVKMLKSQHESIISN